MKILIVEDEIELSEILTVLLEQQKYSVDQVHDGEKGEDYALCDIYDLIILDIMLPKQSGLKVLKAIRENDLSVPVLLLSAKSELDDVVSGLDMGADDYLTKPFESKELLARVRALSRRKSEFIGEFLEYGETKLNKETHELSCQGQKIQLSLKEFEILALLIENQKQIIPKGRFIEKIWGYDNEAEYNTVEVYISFLRKKLLAVNSSIQIKAARGVGYRLEI